jgi:hypothetical protein
VVRGEGSTGNAMQLGWTPPSPLYLVRMALATRRARRKAKIRTPGEEYTWHGKAK